MNQRAGLIMTKKLNMSVLSENMLVEVHTMIGGFWGWFIHKNQKDGFYVEGFSNPRPIRPLSNQWYFNDGSMVLPDGLVCKVSNMPEDFIYKVWTSDKYGKGLWLISSKNKDQALHKLCFEKADYGLSTKGNAIKILGVTEEYREAGEALSMEVIEI